MDPIWIKFAGIALNVLGSLIFTIWATRILSALTSVAKYHEDNIQQLMPTHRGDIYNYANSPKLVERAKGTTALIVGIVMVVVGLALQGISTYLEVTAE